MNFLTYYQYIVKIIIRGGVFRLFPTERRKLYYTKMEIKPYKPKDKAKTDRLSLGRVISNDLWLLRIIWKVCPVKIIMMGVSSVGFALLNFLSGTFLMRYIVNGIQAGKSFEVIIFMVCLLCVLPFVGEVLQNIYHYLLDSKYDVQYDAHLKRMIFEHAREADIACFEDPEYYDKYVLAAAETSTRATSILGSINDIAWTVTSVVANCALLAAIDPWLIVFIVIPVGVCGIQKKYTQVTYNKYNELKACSRRRDYSGRVFYMSEYTKDLRMGNIADMLKARYVKASHEYMGITNKYAFPVVALNAVRDLAIDIFAASGAAVYSLYQAIVTGNMLYGDCLVVLNSVSRMSWDLYWCLNCLVQFQDDAQYIENVRSFMETEPEVTSPADPVPIPEGIGDIEFRDVSFCYKGAEKNTIEHLSFTIKAGERIALVGLNGAGKSTVVKLLLRLYDPTEGAVYFAGRDIREYDLAEWRHRIGAVMQDFKLFSLSVAENVLLRRESDGDRATVTDALTRSGAIEVVEALPNGADTVMTKEFDDEGAALSGGEAQKVALARIFAGHFPIVILDEPSSALDPISEYNMYENMMKALEHSSAMIISHRLSSAVMADRIYLLEGGCVAECGTHSELMEAGGKYAEMFALQARSYRKSEGGEV